jgi:hypothetical protein
MEEYRITRYEFGELNEEAKEAAIEAARSDAYNNTPEQLLTDSLTHELGEILGANSHSKIDLELSYSLGYSQGDGVSFTGSLTPSDAPNMTWPAKVARVEIVRIDRHYSHAFTVRPEFFDVDGEELDPASHVSFRDELREICAKLEKLGYAEIEAWSSRESAIEYLTDAGAVFLESGKISHPVGLSA